MSYFNQIKFEDTPNFDAFSRLRVSLPESLFDNMFEYGLDANLWETSLTNGTVSHIANNCAMRLSTGGTTSGNKAIMQTKKYMRYQPGRSLNIEITFVMSAVQTNAVTRIGYFDADNGIFIERDGSTINLVRRTYVTGSAVNNTVAKASWNVDKLDGTGVSGKTLDLTKTNIFFIQLQFLGVGRVQCGFVIDGIPYVCHQFLNAGVLSTVYMSTGCLPLRAEVINSDTAGGTITMDVFCASVSSGGLGQHITRYSRSNGITAVATSTTLKPIISIRAATLLGGTTGGGSIVNRGHIEPVSFEVSVTGAEHEWEIVRNGTLTNPSWQVNGALSIADYDVSATAITGGTVLESGYVVATASARGVSESELFNALPLVYTGLGSIQGIISVCARVVTGTQTAKASITWDEQF